MLNKIQMHRLCISLVALVCATSAASAGHAVRGKCLLEVKGVSYIKGPCDITMEKPRDFEVSTFKGRLYFAQVSPGDGGTTDAFWNGTIPGVDHAQTYLGAVTRHGNCWINEQAKICASPPGKRKP